MEKKQRNIIFGISFLEGGAVMACELFGAKLVAPFFGASLYVWASVLGVTLGGLAAGYFMGGRVSEKNANFKFLYWLFFMAGLFLLIMPFTSQFIMRLTMGFGVRLGSTISLLVFMLPPLFMMSMMSPYIIKLLTISAEDAGKNAGLVYFVSTLGGIFSTYLIGFYLLPEFGIKIPAIIYGGFLMLIASMLLFIQKKEMSAIVLFLFLFSSSVFAVKSHKKSKYFKIHYESEGILGQLKVVDYLHQSKKLGKHNGRALMVNNTCQTITNADNLDYTLWDFGFFFPNAASIYPKGSDVLLLGLGGGTLVKQFGRLNFNLDVVELDERIKDIAIKYFGVKPATNIEIDDARHYLETHKKKYNVITFDVFLSETPPSYLLTKECFSHCKNLLKPGGMLMINFYGYLTGDLGVAARSVYKTLKTAGYNVNLLPTPGETEASRNLIFLASEEQLDFSHTNYEEPGLGVVTDLTQYFVDPATLNMSNAVLLTDDKPVLEHLYLKPALEWRFLSNQYYTKSFINDNIGLK